MARVEYPKIKKVAWRYVRVFFAAALAQAGLNLAMLSEPEYAKMFAVAAVAAGLEAIAKALREGKPYDSKLHKLPL